ncbi:hypothetical protein [Paenibacillus sp. SYP-B4298]|uniref:hypothetical protein n=1 Tax=Paenibacillus sp. SYP-B4298 TaxID=2996034 RepID=UPI0022DDAC8D|nr:hypothetical protein [Paenibacillus sp. SYP-B4298]
MRWVVSIIMFVALCISTLGLIVNEKFVMLLVVDLGIMLAWWFIITYLSNRKLIKRAVSEGAMDAFICEHIEGLGIGKMNCEIRNYPDKIEIKSVINDHTFVIPHERIRALEIKNEQEFKDLDRSVVGRAVVGTLLVPGLGTIIGGMSGLKQKKKGELRNFLVINYLDKTGNLSGVTFENQVNLIRMSNFVFGVNRSLRKGTIEL